MALEHKEIKKRKGKKRNRLGQNPQPINDVIQLKDYLNLYYEIRHNRITYNIEIRSFEEKTFRIMDDFIFNDMYLRLREKGYNYSATMLERLLKSSYAAPYNPVKTYFEELPPHDGKDYIKELADTIQIEDLSSENIHLKDLWVSCLKKWLVASVAAVLGKGNNHTCLILVGAQGKGKTTWLNKLCPTSLKDN
ncbi:VapE domain-containing protein [Aquimarina aggregata]|uniref:VapE domain-containing protein n=1 Tax=Aquimarina aggregata TaxID=1642818 RepID=UPI002490F9AC|nr:VapE domain-containing protein [Aquimarina aggregata]